MILHEPIVFRPKGKKGQVIVGKEGTVSPLNPHLRGKWNAGSHLSLPLTSYSSAFIFLSSRGMELA